MTGSTLVRRWRVGGRVQGVGFRVATRARAHALGIADGWAHNLADGDVEVCAAGDVGALGALADWLARGPRFAEVTRLEELVPPSAATVGPGFLTGRK